MTPPVYKESPLSAALAGDSSWLLCGESASASVLGVNTSDTSCVESATALVGDSWLSESGPGGDFSSLLGGRGMDTLGSVS